MNENENELGNYLLDIYATIKPIQDIGADFTRTMKPIVADLQLQRSRFQPFIAYRDKILANTKPIVIPASITMGAKIHSFALGNITKELNETFRHLDIDNTLDRIFMRHEYLLVSMIEQIVGDEEIQASISKSSMGDSFGIKLLISQLRKKQSTLPMSAVDLNPLILHFEDYLTADHSVLNSTVYGCASTSAAILGGFRDRFIACKGVTHCKMWQVRQDSGEYALPDVVLNKASKMDEDEHSDFADLLKSLRVLPHRPIQDVNQKLFESVLIGLGLSFVSTEYEDYSNSFFSRHQIAHNFKSEMVTILSAIFWSWTLVGLIDVMQKDGYDFSNKAESERLSNAKTDNWRRELKRQRRVANKISS